MMLNFPACSRTAPISSHSKLAPSLWEDSGLGLQNDGGRQWHEDPENALADELLADQKRSLGIGRPHQNELPLVSDATGLEDFEDHSSPLSETFNVSTDLFIDNPPIR